jgi:hypothetical protein
MLTLSLYASIISLHISLSVTFLGQIILGLTSAEDGTCWFLSGDGRMAFGIIRFFFNEGK